jgi:hypothetical protein
MALADIVSGSYFDVLGVEALRGRTFSAADDAPGRDAVAVISHAYWERRFARDPAAIGKVVTLAKLPFTIIGVTPPRFAGRQPAGRSADIVLPMFVHARIALRDHNTFQIMARLRPGVTLAQAAAELDRLHREAGDAQEERLELKPAMRGEEGLGPNDTKTMQLAAAVIGIVLLIACVNVANLLLARASARGQEMAVRVSIGGSRARLIRQLLTESALLALLGGVLGLFLAHAGVPALLGVLPIDGRSLPYDLRTDARALAFTAGLSVLTALLFGLAPAFAATRMAPFPLLKGEPGGAARPSGNRVLKTLVIPQVALSLALLTATGLLLRSLQVLYAADVGMRRDEVLTMSAYPSLLGYEHEPEMRLYREWLERIGGMPGIRSVALARSSPALFRAVPGRFNIVSPRFFETLGVDVLRGREFTRADSATSAPVAVINDSAARKYFENGDALGRALPDAMNAPAWARAREIVGVVRDSKHNLGQQRAGDELYVPYTQVPAERLGQAVLLVRAVRDPRGAGGGGAARDAGDREGPGAARRANALAGARALRRRLPCDGAAARDRRRARARAGRDRPARDARVHRARPHARDRHPHRARRSRAGDAVDGRPRDALGRAGRRVAGDRPGAPRRARARELPVRGRGRPAGHRGTGRAAAAGGDGPRGMAARPARHEGGPDHGAALRVAPLSAGRSDRRRASAAAHPVELHRTEDLARVGEPHRQHEPAAVGRPGEAGRMADAAVDRERIDVVGPRRVEAPRASNGIGAARSPSVQRMWTCASFSLTTMPASSPPQVPSGTLSRLGPGPWQAASSSSASRRRLIETAFHAVRRRATAR